MGGIWVNDLAELGPEASAHEAISVPPSGLGHESDCRDVVASCVAGDGVNDKHSRMYRKRL